MDKAQLTSERMGESEEQSRAGRREATKLSIEVGMLQAHARSDGDEIRKLENDIEGLNGGV